MDERYLSYQKEYHYNHTLGAQDEFIKSITKQISEFRVMKEIDDLQIRSLKATLASQREKLKAYADMEAQFKDLNEKYSLLKVENGDLQSEVQALKDSNRRLVELVNQTEEFKKLSVLSKDKEADLPDAMLHLCGSKAISKKD